MSYEKLSYILWLSNLRGLGPVAIRALINHFGSSKSVFEATDSEVITFISNRKQLRAPMAKSINEGKDKIKDARELAVLLMDKAIKNNAQIISIEDSEYPREFRDCIGDPPPVLFVKGKLSIFDGLTVAIVGTRNATQRALNFAQDAAIALAKDKWTIISGLAKGIDAAAHTGAISGNGNTIAILGCGVDRIYPPENRELFKMIPESGAIISEFPFGTPPSGENLRKRNKTIVSFSKAVMIIEAPLDSGAMIANKFALDQKKPVFAFVPKDIKSENVSGIVNILASGVAIPVESHRRISTTISHVLANSEGDKTTWDRFITNEERLFIHGAIDDMRKAWLSCTLEAQNEINAGRFTIETNELMGRLNKLHKIGWHTVDLKKLYESLSNKEHSTSQQGKKLRAKIIDALNMVADDIKERLFVNQCKAREKLESKEITAMIFDLDGVIVDSRDLLRNIYHKIAKTFLNEEIPVLRNNLLCQSPKKVLKALLGINYGEDKYNIFKKYFDDNFDKANLCDNIKGIIEILKNRGVKIGLVTSQNRARMEKVLSSTGLNDLFEVKMHWGSTPNKKPHPESLLQVLNYFGIKGSNAIYIGDTPSDILFARSAGITPIIALWASLFKIDSFLEFEPEYFLTAPHRISL